jgi:hypothetical protein
MAFPPLSFVHTPGLPDHWLIGIDRVGTSEFRIKGINVLRNKFQTELTVVSKSAMLNSFFGDNFKTNGRTKSLAGIFDYKVPKGQDLERPAQGYGMPLGRDSPNRREQLLFSRKASKIYTLQNLK